MADRPANEAQGQETNKEREEGIKHLQKRILSSSQTVMLLAVGILVPLVTEQSNKTEGAMRWPKVLAAAYFTLLSGVLLRGLVLESLGFEPGRFRYIAIKFLIHVCANLLVYLAFLLSLMMRMSSVVTSHTLTGATVFVVNRLYQCVATVLEDDITTYSDCQAELQQLLELSTNIASILFGAWYFMASFYFHNYREEERDASFLPSEYLTFFTCVAASLMLLKAVPRTRTKCPRQAREFKVLVWLLELAVMSTAAVIAGWKVGKHYAVLVFLPEAVALMAWLLVWMREILDLPVWSPTGSADEPAHHDFIKIAVPVLLAMLFYLAKDSRMESMYDEALVVIAAADVVAALSWRRVTQQRASRPSKEAASILGCFTFLLLLLSLLFLGLCWRANLSIL